MIVIAICCAPRHNSEALHQKHSGAAKRNSPLLCCYSSCYSSNWQPCKKSLKVTLYIINFSRQCPLIPKEPLQSIENWLYFTISKNISYTLQYPKILVTERFNKTPKRTGSSATAMLPHKKYQLKPSFKVHMFIHVSLVANKCIKLPCQWWEDSEPQQMRSMRWNDGL